MSTATTEQARSRSRVHCSLRELVLYYLKLGSIGFGGPVALLGYMQKDLVDTRKWVDQKDFNDGLALAQLCPGPIASQLSMYIGWLSRGPLGAFLTGAALALPAYVLVLALCWVYISYGEMPPLRRVFGGMSGAVLVVILFAAWRLFKKTVSKRRDLTAIAAVTLVLTIVAGSELFWVFVAAGVAATWTGRKLGPAAFFAFPGFIGQDAATLKKMAWYFFEVGAMVFGSGMVIVPFLYQGVVAEYRWLNETQFQDALAVAMVTPGPAVITVAFMGFLISGLPGSLIAPAGIFGPCYIFTILVAPVFHRIVGRNEAANDFVEGVSAAAVGAIGGAVLLIAWKTAWSPVTIGVFLGAFALIYRRTPDALVILLAGAAGYLLL
ncbi:MAG TPA: chromate efflux transporter [Bdellovibrionales bacterium]|nr:chromate efflux transporter [Bdellovibrionales bacterium]